MARKTLSSFTVLWKRHERLYIEVFKTALEELAEKTIVEGEEDEISESLCPIMNRICFRLGSTRNVEIRVPDWEKPIQPLSEVELKGGKIRKRPDFTCKRCNSYAETSEEYEIPFHIECKRLGAATSPQWKLNENYVTKGISRFDSPIHEYGKRACSGLMVGYMINMNPATIEAEVNSFQATHISGYPILSFQLGDPEYVSEAIQNLNRVKVRPLEFKLFHLWVDIRHNYQNKKN